MTAQRLIRALEDSPPADIPAEQATLGAMLIERDAIARVVGLLRLEDFYFPQHRTIAAHVFRLFRAGTPVDLITMRSALADADQLDAVGGDSCLIKLQDAAPTAAAVMHYARIVLEKARLRRLREAALQLLEHPGDAGKESALRDALTACDGATAPPPVLGWTDLVVTKPPEVDWLIENLIATRSIGLVFADYGHAKTWLALDLSISVARGELVWGTFPVPKALSVLIVDRENGRNRLTRRLSLLARGRGLLDHPLPVFAHCDADYKLDDPAGMRALCQLAKPHSPGLVVLDSFRRFHGGDENSSRDMARVTEALRELVAETGASVLALYHVRKVGMVSNQPREMIRGSKEIGAGMDSTVYVRKTMDGLLVITCDKERDGEEWPSFALRMDESEDGGITFACLGDAPHAQDKKAKAEAVIISAVIDAGGALDRPSILEACQRAGIAKTNANEALKRVSAGRALRKAGKQGRRQFYTLSDEGPL